MSKSISFRSNPYTELMVDDDPNRVIRLDLGDVGILTRFKEITPMIEAIAQALPDKQSAGSVDFQQYAAALEEAEKKLTELINRIFNADVCTAAANGASLFALADGYPLYERILSVLAELYGEEMERQAKLRLSRISKHTGKYVK